MRNFREKAIISFLIIAITGLCFGGCGEKKEEGAGDVGTRNTGTENESTENVGAKNSDTENESTENTGEGNTGTENENSGDSDVFRAVYLKNDRGDLFVNLENDTPFTGSLPEEIIDEEGKAITEDSMENGDVFLVYGDGVMLESYPGQYPGITRLERQESGNQELAEKYQDLIEQFLPEPDLSQPPQLSVAYRQPDAAVTVNITRGSYSWTVDQGNGEAESTIADAAHVLEWKDELIDLTLTEETELCLQFDAAPQSVEVVYWPVQERREVGTTGTYPEGEAAEVSENGEEFTFIGKPDQVYRVKAFWEQGQAEYGFYTVQK